MTYADSKTSYRFLSEEWREQIRKNKEIRDRERLKKPLKTTVHPLMIFNYLVLVALTSGMYYFLRNHFLMLCLSIIISAPVLDLIALFFLYRGTGVKISAPEKEVTKNSIGFLKLELINKSIMASFDICVKLDVENTFYKDQSGTVLSLPLRARSDYKKNIPIRYTMNGICKYSVSTITVRDFLGLISVRKKTDSVAEVYVLPENVIATDLDMTDMSRGMTESEETMKKGHDFSDVSDVREYIPGDKLMSIHWKLSAKRDILMVKDRVSMSDQQMVILVELSGRDEEVDEVLSLAYGVINRFIREQTYVRLMWWSEGNFAFEERQIMNYENLKEAFSDIYYETVYADGEKTKGYMRSIRPELKAYVNICMKDGKADAVIVEQD